MKILLHGASGVMGKNVQAVVSENPDCSIVAGVDRGIHAEESSAFPVYPDIKKVKEDFDVIIDFSVKEAVDALLAFAVEKKKALVLCTTGLSETQLEKIEEAGRTIPILQSGNMSLGINVLEELLRIAAGKLYQEGFDVPLVQGCGAYLICRLLPEPHNQQTYDLFIGEVAAVWADDRVYADGRWLFDSVPDELKTLHYVGNGLFYRTGKGLKVG